MICPKCLSPKSLKKWVTITVECPTNQRALDKTAMRKAEVSIVAVDWPNARYYCSVCNYHSRGNYDL